MDPRTHIAVIGAGAFGGWTALHLLRSGARVTLLDAWGPGNARSSSGGETRSLRAIYGPDRVYVDLVARSLQLWREHEARWRRPLFCRTGAIWMTGADDRYEAAALPILRAAGIAVAELGPDAAARQFPQICFDGVRRVFHEPDAGFLLARVACSAVLDGFLAEGGTYRQVAVTPGPIRGGMMSPPGTSEGDPLLADAYVFACGSWLGRVWPDVVGDRINSTRQEVFFFGTPAGDSRFLPGRMPVWIDRGATIRYGIPGNIHRGFKVADDTRGAPFDPTGDDRTPSPAGLQAARDYLAIRFPDLADAPLLESRVCPYENTPDGHFLIDRHPEAANVWLLGGGSGHGFKHGPAVGEHVAALVLEGADSITEFGFDRSGLR